MITEDNIKMPSNIVYLGIGVVAIAIVGVLAYFLIFRYTDPTTDTRQGFFVENAPNDHNDIFFYGTTDVASDMNKRDILHPMVYVNGKATGVFAGYFSQPVYYKRPKEVKQGWAIHFKDVPLKIGDLVRTEATITDINGKVTKNILEFTVKTAPIPGAVLY